jgi:hypothetical protein
MPNALGFNELGTNRACIELGCNFSGPVWEMGEDVQKEHFLSHYREPQEVVNVKGMAYILEGEIRVQACRACGNQFSQPRRRGRPRLECDNCKGDS